MKLDVFGPQIGSRLPARPKSPSPAPPDGPSSGDRLTLSSLLPQGSGSFKDFVKGAVLAGGAAALACAALGALNPLGAAVVLSSAVVGGVVGRDGEVSPEALEQLEANSQPWASPHWRGR